MRAWSLLLGAALLPICSAHAADIYKWVDENGRTQLSDRVPEKYRANATHLGDSRQHELTPEQQKEAQARAAGEKQRRAADEAQTKAAQGRSPAAPVSDLDPVGNDQEPNQLSAADCQAWYAAYQASYTCYAPFRNKNGSLKPGAFDACGQPVRDPSRKCAVPVLPK
jgi:hypothetical protein